MKKIKNNTFCDLHIDNIRIKVGETTDVSEQNLSLLQSIYGNKIEILNEKTEIENAELKKRIAELEAKNQEPEKTKEDKTLERITMETKAKELNIKSWHLLSDEKLANKIMEIETAPTV